jgi:hypothetical protein
VCCSLQPHTTLVAMQAVLVVGVLGVAFYTATQVFGLTGMPSSQGERRTHAGALSHTHTVRCSIICSMHVLVLVFMHWTQSRLARHIHGAGLPAALTTCCLCHVLIC